MSRWTVEPTSPLPADALRDMQTSGNSLSLFLVEEDALLPRAIAAIASCHKSLGTFDLARVPVDAIVGAGFQLEPNPGSTIDHGVNSWHQDAIELNAQRLVDLSNILRAGMKRYHPKDVAEYIKLSLSHQYITEADLRDKMSATSIERFGILNS